MFNHHITGPASTASVIDTDQIMAVILQPQVPRDLTFASLSQVINSFSQDHYLVRTCVLTICYNQAQFDRNNPDCCNLSSTATPTGRQSTKSFTSLVTFLCGASDQHSTLFD
jgi:hypothetical protein